MALTMSSKERDWNDVKHIGGCPVCGHTDWCTYKEDKGNEDHIVVTCMREHDSEEFEALGKRGKENAQGELRTIYLVPWNGNRPQFLLPRKEKDLPPVNDQREFIFQDEHGNPTHKEIHKSAVYHWNGSAWVIGRGARKKPLYRLPYVLEAVAAGEDVWITEGYKDADTLCGLGLCATSGGSSTTWLPEYTQALCGAKRVILCGDMDEPGQEHLEKLKQMLPLVVGEVQEISAFPGFEFGTGADVTDYLEAGHTLQDLLTLMEPVGKPTLPTYSLDELLTMDIQTDWLIESVLAPKGIVMLLGPPASGKSLLSLDLAYSLAYKEQWLDHLPIKRNCNVLLLSGEGGAEVLSERAKARTQSQEERLPTGKMMRFWTEDRDENGGLCLSREKVAAIVGAIRQHGIEVLIIDPLIEFHAGDENSQQEMGELIKVLREIIHATDVCVVVTHHTRKGGRDTQPGDMLEGRGSGVLVGAAETVLSLVHKAGVDERHLFFSKVRRGRKPEDIALQFEDDLVFRWVRDLDESDKRPARLGGNQKVKPDKLLDLVSREGPITPKEIEREWGIASSRTIKVHLDALCEQGCLQRRQRPGRGRELEYLIPSTGGTPTTTSTASDASGSLL